MKIFNVSNILIPRNIDMSKWSVIACDQHTSDVSYWEKLKDFVSDSPSTLNLVIPEAYLNKNVDEIINSSNKSMVEYIDNQIFKEYKNCLIYVERQLTNSSVRKGLIGQVDLEYYSDNINSEKTRILPSECIVENRIFPRIKLREEALLDIPHTLLFCVDKEDKIIGNIKRKVHEINKIYDFDLNMDGGHIVGYRIDNKESKNIVTQLNKLSNESLGFIVADGNHSLMAAKQIYENYKQTHSDYLTSALRYALVEVVNLHSEAIKIYPIHRILSNVDYDKLIEEFTKRFQAEKGNVNKSYKYIEVISEHGTRILSTKTSSMLIENIQKFLDEFISSYGGNIDYIHDEKVLSELCKGENRVGIKFPIITKQQLVEHLKSGKLWTKKSFSVGLESDKRYYLECRALK